MLLPLLLLDVLLLDVSSSPGQAVAGGEEPLVVVVDVAYGVEDSPGELGHGEHVNFFGEGVEVGEACGGCYVAVLLVG